MANTSKAARPIKRKGYWYLARHVPRAYRSIEPRAIVFLSTNIPITDDPRGVKAARAVEMLDRGLHHRWSTLMGGGDVDGAYDAATALARTEGFVYMPAHELADQPEEAVRRLLALAREGRSPDDPRVHAVLGGVAAPGITLSTLVATYEALFCADKLKDFSPGQLRKWRVAQSTAADMFACLVGDKDIALINREDVLLLRGHLNARILAGEIARDTARRIMTRLAGMHRDISTLKQLDLPEVFRRASFTRDEEGEKSTFDLGFVQDVILKEGALDGLNAEARGILYLVADLGIRPSEAIGLTRDHIKLEHEVPHILIRGDVRKLKTKHARRNIPLSGLSLAVMRAFPHGFPGYDDRNASLSALLNKAMRARGWLDDEQTLYSFRHTFRDRLMFANAPHDLECYLMGHARGDPKYGKGNDLKHSHGFIERIAFKPPARL